MNKRSYKAFTLIEMLIVMGILIILMAVGVAAGRFAIDRANEISHKNGATQLYQALQAYYTDNLKFPEPGSNFKNMLSSGGILLKYLDMGSFKGGSDATYYYFTNKEKQSAIVCVTLGGTADSGEKGVVCVGNGFDVIAADCVGTTTEGTDLNAIKKEKYEKDDDFRTKFVDLSTSSSACVSDWNSDTKSF
jgi:type II secretory pathway pseudopilin PulG